MLEVIDVGKQLWRGEDIMKMGQKEKIGNMAEVIRNSLNKGECHYNGGGNSQWFSGSQGASREVSALIEDREEGESSEVEQSKKKKFLIRDNIDLDEYFRLSFEEKYRLKLSARDLDFVFTPTIESLPHS